MKEISDDKCSRCGAANCRVVERRRPPKSQTNEDLISWAKTAAMSEGGQRKLRLLARRLEEEMNKNTLLKDHLLKRHDCDIGLEDPDYGF